MNLKDDTTLERFFRGWKNGKAYSVAGIVPGSAVEVFKQLNQLPEITEATVSPLGLRFLKGERR